MTFYTTHIKQHRGTTEELKLKYPEVEIVSETSQKPMTAVGSLASSSFQTLYVFLGTDIVSGPPLSVSSS